MTKHTVLIFQKTNNPNTRTWTEHANITAALEAIIGMFEKQLAQTYPDQSHINYQVGDLIGFIGQCKEFVALIFDQKVNAYVPRDKAWIQEKIVSHLRLKLEKSKKLASHDMGNRASSKSYI
ncbi:enhancer of rudimentary-like [Gigaspora margarita]|uniref:Enhancer of rudimentary-like n=1 Tax=Gigaspora margarita TaxID=4874 RepID=A0A8H4A7H8_GIGMA|nr:enhancer of rudimentary-like [Gigaspora margarita]